MRVTQESLRECKASSAFSGSKSGPSKGKSSIVCWTSMSDDYSQEARCIVTTVAVTWAAESASCNAACKDDLASRLSLTRALNSSLASSGLFSTNFNIRMLPSLVVPSEAELSHNPHVASGWIPDGGYKAASIRISQSQTSLSSLVMVLNPLVTGVLLPNTLKSKSENLWQA